MTTPTNLYRKMKHRARRLLLKGDIGRYMRTLRELHELRSMSAGLSA